MPEGHTIHRLARDHTRWFGGQRLLADSPQGRAEQLAEAVSGLELEGADAYGKHLFHRWEGRLTVHVHLGLFGRFRRWKAPPPEPTAGTRLRLFGETHVLSLSGPTACRLIDPGEEEALLARLGPDPLRPDADPHAALSALARRRIPIAAAILDQRVIAGLGNVYRAEALNVLGIDPMLPARDLGEERFEELWSTITTMLEDGVRERRIVTRRDGPRPYSRTPRDRATWVYRREHCGRCGTATRTEEVGARKLYWCPTCQPRQRRRRR
jgi:endonuclease VIII